MSEKFIFLDIDGVLNSTASAIALGGFPHNFSPAHKRWFDKVALGLVKRAVLVSGAKVVISSTWRRHFTIEEFTKGLGFKVIGKTGYSYSGFRGKEVAEWLEEHAKPEDRYVIIDDDRDFNSDQLERCVFTNHSDGFKLEHAHKVLELFDLDPLDIYTKKPSKGKVNG